MKFLERHAPLLISFICSITICIFIIKQQGFVIDFQNGNQNTPYEIAKLICSISGTILGFLLTAVAMLTAIMDRKLVENMRKTGHYKVFIVDCFVNCFVFLITIILGITCLFTINPNLSYIFYLMILFAMTALFMLVEQGRRFLLIFTKV
ncbi:hypothetical protein ACG907_02775 [Acinetobacter bereziniae]|uniref:hypothetical protein n=1 Tax=Acinetobacter bereziniae TaxID=106648 RepID=UPI0021E3ABA0|nr:hypothetical protein [Acinetobacter bereziniae]MCV2444777.1 hypothetical protein [Acinetobacter bereziniae]